MTDSTTSGPHTPSSPNAGHPAPAAGQAASPATETEPHELQAPANTTGQQPFAHDANHDQNEVAGASRGEFGRQSEQGVTHAGYGAEPSRGDATYAGTLKAPAATTGYIGEREQRQSGFDDTTNGSHGTQPVGGTSPSHSGVGTQFANDNAAPQGPDSGYAENYGTSSLGGNRAGNGQPIAGQRNQQEGYLPSNPEEGGPEGQRTGVAPNNTSQGTDEADATPTTGSGSGYQAAGSPDAQGGEQTGFGSKGGSYNDEYDAADNGNQPDSSPSRGDYTCQDAAPNYGGASDDRTNTERNPDYGPMPGRPGSPE